MMNMRIVAIIASYNEEKFIRACLENYSRQGVEVYLIDNESEDRTVEIASEYLGKNLIKIESIKRNGYFELGKQLRRKEELADELTADWFIHADPDEIRLPPSSDQTLAVMLEQVDREGYNAVNFMEFTFIPTYESPDHDHENFQQTMRWYYPFAPRYPNRVNAWKKVKTGFSIRKFSREVIRQRRFRIPSVDLTASGGHHIQFEGLKLYPQDFKMRHYLVLSLGHAIQKYVNKKFDPREVSQGQHGWRALAKQYDFQLPSQSDLLFYINDDELDASKPLKQHLLVKKA